MAAKITLTIGKRKLTLTPAEARQLHKDLDAFVNGEAMAKMLQKIEELRRSIPASAPPIYRDFDRERERYRRVTPQWRPNEVICRTSQSSFTLGVSKS